MNGQPPAAWLWKSCPKKNRPNEAPAFDQGALPNRPAPQGRLRADSVPLSAKGIACCGTSFFLKRTSYGFGSAFFKKVLNYSDYQLFKLRTN
jgi:hypothetical protein